MVDLGNDFISLRCRVGCWLHRHIAFEDRGWQPVEGVALYPVHARINHACDPNAAVISEGFLPNISVQCTRNVRANEQVTPGARMLSGFYYYYLFHNPCDSILCFVGHEPGRAFTC
jgi:hypothetical protein